jgi:hypothetical protein
MSENNNKELLKDTFPSNSKTRKSIDQQDTEEKPEKLQKIITGGVKTKKRSFGKKMAETFLEDDTKSVTSYILHDVLIPAAKAMISDMVGGGIEMLLFGERRRGSSSIRRDGSRSYTSYGSYYRSDSRDNRPPSGREISKTARARHEFDDVVLDTRGEAEDVLSRLVDLTMDYGQATVADLYDLVGITGSFTDNKWGWTDLRSASVSRVRDGYLINLPRTQPLD